MGCVDLIYTILDRLLETEWVEKVTIERAHCSKEVKTDKNGEALPRPIHVKVLNWEDKEYILKLAPSKLKHNRYQGKAHIIVTDDVTKKVRDERKSLRNNYLDEIRGRPDVKVAFVPFLVPAFNTRRMTRGGSFTSLNNQFWTNRQCLKIEYVKA